MTSKLRYTPVVIVIVTLIFLASYFSITYDEKEKKDEIGREIEVIPLEHLPDIMISHENDLRLYRYSNTTFEYENESTYHLPDIISMEKFGENLLISHAGGLTLLNRDLQRLGDLEIPEPMDIGVDGDTIYCCSNSSLYSISSDLEIIDSIYLNTTDWGGGKNAHDIIFHDGSAYLLDNVVFPIYVFKVDISDPGNLEMELGFQIVDINQHLSAQWLDPATDRWFIHQHMGYMGGTDQNILCYSSENGSFLWKQEIYHKSWEGSERDHGFTIEAITPTTSGWALAQNRDGQDLDYYLMEFDSNGDRVVFEKIMDLGSHVTSYGRPYARILRHEDNLFIKTIFHLVVINIEDEPIMVLSQLFEDKTTDIIVE